MKEFNTAVHTNVIQIISDAIFGYVAFLIAYFFVAYYCATFYDAAMMIPFVPLNTIYVVFIMIYILANKARNAYNVTTFFYVDRYIKYVEKDIVTAGIAVVLIIFLLGYNKVSGLFCIIFLIISDFMLLVSMLFVGKLLNAFSKGFKLRALFIGNRKQYDMVNYYLGKTNIPITPIGCINLPDESVREDYLGSLDWFEKIIHTNAIDHIYFFEENFNRNTLQRYLDLCMEVGVTASTIQPFYDVKHAYSFISSVGKYPITTYHTVSLNAYNTFAKRIVDIIGSMFGIVLLSPLMLITAIAIKLDSKGPVFYRQKRAGLNGRVFDMLKFRSMLDGADRQKKALQEYNEIGSSLMFKMKNDPRITRVGKIIRKMSIDELPQLFNVLKGEMSLVGTRPPTIDEVAQYNRGYWKRISIKPGMTGMWQVNGRSKITDFDAIVSLDKKYIEEWSIGLDFFIMFKTVYVLLFKPNAY